MDIKAIITTAITVITAFFPSPTGAVAAIKSLLTAISNSPEFLTWLQGLLTKQQTIPGGALGVVEIDPNDAELQAAWKASPMLHRWANDHAGQHPAGTEAFGLGGIAALISLLPTLLKILPQIQQLMPVIQQIIDLFKNLQPATPTA